MRTSYDIYIRVDVSRGPPITTRPGPKPGPITNTAFYFLKIILLITLKNITFPF